LIPSFLMNNNRHERVSRSILKPKRFAALKGLSDKRDNIDYPQDNIDEGNLHEELGLSEEQMRIFANGFNAFSRSAMEEQDRIWNDRVSFDPHAMERARGRRLREEIFLVDQLIMVYKYMSYGHTITRDNYRNLLLLDIPQNGKRILATIKVDLNELAHLCRGLSWRGYALLKPEKDDRSYREIQFGDLYKFESSFKTLKFGANELEIYEVDWNVVRGFRKKKPKDSHKDVEMKSGSSGRIAIRDGHCHFSTVLILFICMMNWSSIEKLIEFGSVVLKGTKTSVVWHRGKMKIAPSSVKSFFSESSEKPNNGS